MAISNTNAIDIPVPDKKGSKTASRKVITFSIALWGLILSGLLAGLVLTVGQDNEADKKAAALRQNAYQELLPALKLVDEKEEDGTRESVLLSALDIIENKVLTLDSTHQLAIQTKDEIQTELASIQADRINESEQAIETKDQTIAEQENSINEAKSEIEKHLSSIDAMKSDNATMKQQNDSLTSVNATLRHDLVTAQAAQANLLTQMKQIEHSKSQLHAANSKLESTNNWYASTNKKLESTNKWLTGEKSKLTREVCYWRDKYNASNAASCKKDREIALLRKQILALKQRPVYKTLPYKP